MSCSRFQRPSKALPDGFDCCLRVIQGSDASILDNVVASRTASPHWRAWSKPRRDKGLLFQPVKRGIHGTRSHLVLKAALNVLQDRPPIGVFPEMYQSQENGLFKCSEDIRHDYIVDM